MIDNKKEVAGYLILTESECKMLTRSPVRSPMVFPAVSGFLGAFHAMSRKLQQHETLGYLSLGGVLIACHDCQVKAYRQTAYSDYTFNQTRNPIKKDGTTASIIEEGKCGLVVTLVVEVLADDAWDVEPEHTQALMNLSHQWIQQQRLAGGSVLGLSSYEPVRYIVAESIDEIKRHLLPAFVLIQAQDDLIGITHELQKNNPAATALDALIEVATLHHNPEQSNNGTTDWRTSSVKSGRGWLVPIPIGFQGISACFEPGIMQHSRNPEYSSQYVEAVYSLGKWVFPYRLDDLKQAFWRYHHDSENNLYLTIQANQLSHIQQSCKGEKV